MKYIVLSFFLFTFSFIGKAQIPITSEQAQEELDKRGITETELRQKLLEKGIDVDKIDPSNPLEIDRVQQAIEEAIVELEQEKDAQNKIIPTSPDSTEQDVKETIEPKDTNKETQDETDAIVSEELLEQENLPPPSIYGQQIFRNQNLQLFGTVRDIKPPDSYVLGVGDEVGISIFGISQGDFTFEIDRDGYIKPNNIPRILLKGITYGQAKKLLQNRFRQYYVFNNGQFIVTVNAARTLTVNIFGELINYGSFTVSAVNTALNALIAAGGPSDIGTLRNIQLIRNGQTQRMDIYELMQNPSVQYDFFLENNDIIHVPVQERVVFITGAVKRPMRYELIKGENLLQLIHYAGGLTDDAYIGNIQIKRFVNNEEVILDVDLKQLQSSNRDFDLLSGDSIAVKNIPKPFQNFVEIEGAVELPGKYQLETNMRINNLLEKSIIQKEARTDIAFLLRTNPNQTIQFIKLNLDNIINNPNSSENILLQPKDNLNIYALERYTDKASISVSGAVRKPEEYPYDPSASIRIQDAILMAGGLKQDALDFAYIIRLDSRNLHLKKYIRVNVREAMNNPNSASNQALQAFDELNILSQSNYMDISTVSVSGAVRNPGEFPYSGSLTLQDALILAGGLKLEAASNRIDIFRIEINDNQPTKTIAAQVQANKNLPLALDDQNIPLQAFDQIVVRSVPDFEFQESIFIEGEVLYPGQYALLGNNERLLSVLQRAGGLTTEAFPEGASLLRAASNTGVIITKIEEIIKNPHSPFNYILKDGDILTIPKNKDLVTIKLQNTKAAELYPDKFLEEGKINLAYQHGKHAKWYIKEYAAGIAETGSSNRLSVEHPNGAIQKTTNLGLFKIYPKVRKGSVITVGTKPAKKEKEEEKRKEPVDWEKVIANSLAQISAVLTLILLVQQVN